MIDTVALRGYDLKLDQQTELLDEIDRLRSLVKDAETARDGECAWCGAERYVRVGKEPHGYRKPCPAFTPEGIIR